MRGETREALVDRVARDLTAGEPSAEFGRQVLDRIAVVRPTAPPWHLQRVAACVAAAGLLLATGLLTAYRGLVPGPLPWAQLEEAASPPAPSMAVPRVAAEAERALADRQAQVGRLPAPTAEADDAALMTTAAWQARAIPALDALPALVLDDLPATLIQPAAVALPLLNIEPLATPRVMIAPLGASAERVAR